MEPASIPLIEEDAAEPLDQRAKKSKKAASVFIIAIAATLAVCAVIAHISVIIGAIGFMKEKGAEFLFSFILPEYIISEPQVPQLPEGELMESPPPASEEADTDSLYRSEDLSAKAENGFALSNETSYNPDLETIFHSERPCMTFDEIDEGFYGGAPKVLIYHTHATEGYRDTEENSFRSHDCKKNVVAIGAVMAEVLRGAGIETIHLTELFDGEDWSASYANSSSAVRVVLSKYPSIQYVFDIHRDCIGNEETGYIYPTAEVFEKKVAQIMTVVGTDEGGSSHTQWRDNLSFALWLQGELWSKYEGFVRPINLRRASFYQDTRAGALLLEIGTCANTLNEAKRSAVLFTCSLCDYIYGYDINMDEKYLMEALCP